MWWEFVIYGAVALVVLYLVIWQRAFVKKYWKWLLAAIPLIVVIVRIIVWIAGKRQGRDDPARQLQGAITSMRDSIQEANMEATVRIAAARAKDQAKMEELKKVMRMSDKAARRRALAGLVG